MPDARELPGVRRAVVPLVRAGDAVVDELVAHRLPRLAAVVGALDQLPEPAAGLRRIQPIRVGGRSLEVVDLPAGEVGTADVPPFALAVRRQDERALACADQYPYPAHPSLLPELGPTLMAGWPIYPFSRHSAVVAPLCCRPGGHQIDTLGRKRSADPDAATLPNVMRRTIHHRGTENTEATPRG